MAAPSPLSVRITIGLLAILGFLGIVWLSMTITRWVTTPGTPTPIATPTSQPQPPTGTSTHTPTVATDDGESYPYPTGPSLDGECTLPEGEFTMNPAMPESKWMTRDHVWFIEHPTLGPQKTTDGVRHCFQHSTAGMIYAAANHIFYADYLSDSPNPDKPKRVYAESFRDNNTFKYFVPPNYAYELQPISFSITSTNKTSGSVRLYVHNESNGQIFFQTLEVELVWENSDWRVSNRSKVEQIPMIPETSTYF